MLQRYHLVLRRPEKASVFADVWPLGWLLPIVVASARERGPHIVTRFLERFNINATVACVTSGILDREASGIDWLALVEERSSVCANTLRECAVDELLESCAVIPIQSDLLRAYQRLSATTESALSPEWLTDATSWATRFLPDHSSDDGFALMSHRADLFEAVWEFRYPAASFYLKWRGQGPFLDPDVAEIIDRDGGARVPVTIAYDRPHGRWLTEGVSGAGLTADLSPRTISRVAEAMALAQINLVPVVHKLRSIGVREESLADLAAESDRILDRLPREHGRPAIRAARSAIHHACAELDALRLPPTWIHTDFIPENVFIDGDVVRFIDFDDPWIGPAPVAMEFLYSGLRRYLPDVAARSAAKASGYESFSPTWGALVAPDVTRRAFASTRLVAEVLRISRRLCAYADKERNGELAGFVEPAAHESARRLMAVAASDLTKSAWRSA